MRTVRKPPAQGRLPCLSPARHTGPCAHPQVWVDKWELDRTMRVTCRHSNDDGHKALVVHDGCTDGALFQGFCYRYFEEKVCARPPSCDGDPIHDPSQTSASTLSLIYALPLFRAGAAAQWRQEDGGGHWAGERTQGELPLCSQLLGVGFSTRGMGGGVVREKGSIDRTINQLLRALGPETPKIFWSIETGQKKFPPIHGK